MDREGRVGMSAEGRAPENTCDAVHGTSPVRWRIGGQGLREYDAPSFVIECAGKKWLEWRIGNKASSSR